MIRINIAPLEPGVHVFDLEPMAADLELDPDRFRDVRVHLRLDRTPDRVLAVFDARATATLECDRTLQLFDQELRGSYSVLFASPEFLEEVESGYDDVQPLVPADTEIDLTTPVRDTILLAIPARKIAPGAEEAEIPMRFGVPEGDVGDIDPRWEALRRLRDSEG